MGKLTAPHTATTRNLPPELRGPLCDFENDLQPGFYRHRGTRDRVGHRRKRIIKCFHGACRNPEKKKARAPENATRQDDDGRIQSDGKIMEDACPPPRDPLRLLPSPYS